MSRHKKDPLRELTESERQELVQLSRSQSAPAAGVIRARILLAVAARRAVLNGGTLGPGRNPATTSSHIAMSLSKRLNFRALSRTAREMVCVGLRFGTPTSHLPPADQGALCKSNM